MVSLCSWNAFLMNFLFYIFLLLHWWLLFYGGLWENSHIKTFSQNATTRGEAGYWFIPEALIRKTGSQHKVFPALYSNEAEFALWCAALILETKERKKWDFQIKLTQAMVHYGTGRLSLKGSCSITAPEVGRAGGAWRDGVSLRTPPTGCWSALGPWDAPSSGLFWRSGSL